MRFSRESIAMHSETGVRKGNEDKCAFRVSEDQTAALLVVADGMGGQACGEVASDRAVSTVLKAFDKYGFAESEELLAEAIQTAHETIQREAAEDAAKEGMGTTIVAMVLKENELLVGHVGDSRAFQFRPPSVRRLTRDHLYVIEVLGLDENVAKHHPKGHVLAQALGIEGNISPTFTKFDIAPGDKVVLCSDGVYGSLDEPAMSRILAERSLQDAAINIVRTALTNGSRDNCTVVAAVLPGT